MRKLESKLTNVSRASFHNSGYLKFTLMPLPTINLRYFLRSIVYI